MSVKKDLKREKKYSTRPLKDFSAAGPVIFGTTRRQTAKTTWKFFLTIQIDFFALQHLQKLHITHRPVVYVDTETDKKIPFIPSKVSDYALFFPLISKPIDYLKKRLGYKTAAPYIVSYLEFLTRIYKNSCSIYKYAMTTTHRPKYYKNIFFRAIHNFDPHLLCIPSLHVAVSAGTYAWFKNFFRLGLISEEEVQMRLKELRDAGISITESVLFVKQHSVNCVPLALYMLTSTTDSSIFPTSEALAFIDDLFKNSSELPDQIKKEINEYFHFMYERSLLENCYSESWQESIKHWIFDYAKKTGQAFYPVFEVSK